VKDRRDTLLQELQKLIECVLHDGHSGWRELSQDTQLKLKDNTISERRFSDAFASALTQMRLSQYRVGQSAWRSGAIASLGRSKLVCFPFVGSIGP
jgi:hypothetical protein